MQAHPSGTGIMAGRSTESHPPHDERRGPAAVSYPRLMMRRGVGEVVGVQVEKA